MRFSWHGLVVGGIILAARMAWASDAPVVADPLAPSVPPTAMVPSVGVTAPIAACPAVPGCCPDPGRYGDGPRTYGQPEAPFWYADFDAVALWRDADGHHAIATLGPQGDVVLDTGDLELEFQAGMQGRVGWMIGPRFGVEFSCVATGDWGDEVFYRDDTLNARGGRGNLFSPLTDFGDPAILGVDYNELSRIGLRSRMGRWEINLRQRLPMPCDVPMQVSLLYGLRYMDVDERFDYLTVSRVPGPARSRNLVDVSTDNDLFGVQIGGITEFHVDPRWWIDVRFVGSVCSNSAEQNTLYAHQDALGAITVAEHGRSKSVTALLGELGLDFRYQVTPYLAIRFGYQAIWAHGLALAEDNFADDLATLRFGPAELDHDGTVVYHGPHLGVGLTW